MTNVKIQRISSSILRELTSIFHEEVNNELLKTVTITDVKVTNDLSMAKVYYTFLSNESKQKMQEELTNAAAYLRCILADKIEIRNVPELRFTYDTSSEYGEHIEDIIEEIHNEK